MIEIVLVIGGDSGFPPNKNQIKFCTSELGMGDNTIIEF